jgi:uncharacterized membrane-anchored protein
MNPYKILQSNIKFKFINIISNKVKAFIALGDFLADNSGLGFAGGAILIGSLLALIALAYYFTKVSHVIYFG